MRKVIKKFIKIIEYNWIFFTLTFLLLISIFSLYPLNEQPKVYGWSDKIHHLIAYALLSIAIGIKKPKKWIFILLIFTIYSGLIELIQPFVNRFGELEDFLFNIIGIILGFLFGRFLKSNIELKL